MNQDNLIERCKYCGSEIERHYNVMAEGECFECWHWRINYEADQQGRNFAIIDGHHYVIEPDKPNCNHQSCFCGFGGHRFAIEFLDGRIIETRNLWYQGEISPYWRQFMPDNARFLPTMKWAEDNQGNKHLELRV